MKKIILVLCIIGGFAACNKESDSPTATEALTGSKWQLERITVQAPVGSAPVDITLLNYKLCELDDKFEFKSGGSYVASENSIVCFPVNNSPFYNLGGGTWALSNNDANLTISKGAENVEFTIKSFSVNALDLRVRFINQQGQDVEYSYNLVSVQ